MFCLNMHLYREKTIHRNTYTHTHTHIHTHKQTNKLDYQSIQSQTDSSEVALLNTTEKHSSPG